ncbi:MAG TPA: holo-ACP synthase [Candidatus Polarisedimenticolaceae bacterium]|nr:holo-ACP synthase [Candidatus Polarisedimenticolaceae bacterium]
MIVGLGIDVMEVERMASALREHGGRLEERVFTEAERAACASRADRVLALAARFAAKEACMKALGTGWAGGLGFRDVEVVREGEGAPRLVLSGEAARRAAGLGVVRSHVSLSHQPGLAAAVVILER